MRKSGDVGRLSADVGTDFCRFFGRPTTFCRSTQVKSFVDRFADFQGFCHRWSVGRLSPDDRPTIGRLFNYFFIMISVEARPIIGRQSADNRQTVGRWHFIEEPSADRRRISAVIRPMFARLSADHIFWFVLYCVQCIYPHYLWNYIMHLFYFWIHFIWPRIQVRDICFFVGFPIELFVWRFEINVSTTSKRLQPNSGHSLIYDDCNLILNNLLYMNWTIRMKFWN